MKPTEAEQFGQLVADVAAFYRQDLSEFASRVWWNALAQYEFKAIKEAFNRHCVNPDNGRFMPKPADIVRMLEGSTQDSALLAWSKVDRAVRTVGTHRSVVFDDALVHRVLADMGGWVMLGTKDEKEWPFLRNEFVNRYRGFRERSETPDYPNYLPGIAESQNAQQNFITTEGPTMIGDPYTARRVFMGGSEHGALQITHNADLAKDAIKRLPIKRPPEYKP